MTVLFTNHLPPHLPVAPVVISGDESLNLKARQNLMLEVGGIYFEIRYDHRCSPFKDVMVVNNLLVAGHERHFYIFDIATNTNWLALKMQGYFGHLYFNDEYIYVTDAFGLICISFDG